MLLLFLLLAGAPARQVAVTFDDLPGPPGGLVSNDVPALRENTRKLLAAFAAHHVPVVGFVNEGKLVVAGEGPEGAAARTGILKMWADAGHELGNHTYSHLSLDSHALEEYEADLVRGEPVTRDLMERAGRRLRYFRHPFLQVGGDLDKRRAFESFLAARGYTVAPVTIDDDDYVYAAVYADARRRGDAAFARKVREDYVRYMEQIVSFDEEVSRNLLGRELPQVLLLHANTLNADAFADVAAMLEARSYRFVTLEAALRDPAYARKDTYVGKWGISWLHHWELTEGRKRSPSPDAPGWVMSAYEALSR